MRYKAHDVFIFIPVKTFNDKISLVLTLLTSAPLKIYIDNLTHSAFKYELCALDLFLLCYIYLYS